MGKLTPEMIQAIRNRYNELPSYKKVAKEFRIDWKTVKNHVGTARSSNMEKKGQSAMPDTAMRDADPAKGMATSVHKGKFATFMTLVESGKSLMNASIEADLSDSEAERFPERYCQLKGMQLLQDLYVKKPRFLQNAVKVLSFMEKEKIDPQMYLEELSLAGSFRKIRLLYSETEEKLRTANPELEIILTRKQSASDELDDLVDKIQTCRKEYPIVSKQVEAKKVEDKGLDLRIEAKNKTVKELDRLLEDKSPILKIIVEKGRANLRPEVMALVKFKHEFLPLAVVALIMTLREDHKFRSIVMTLAEQGVDAIRIDPKLLSVLSALIDETYEKLVELEAKKILNIAVPNLALEHFSF